MVEQDRLQMVNIMNRLIMIENKLANLERDLNKSDNVVSSVKESGSLNEIAPIYVGFRGA